MSKNTNISPDGLLGVFLHAINTDEYLDNNNLKSSFKETYDALRKHDPRMDKEEIKNQTPSNPHAPTLD